MDTVVLESDTCIDDISSELITYLYRNVGIKAALKTLPTNSKLHRAWQAAVENVTVETKRFDEQVVNTLAKLVNLTELKVKGEEYEAVCHPVWHANVSTSLFLTRLRSISLVNVPQGLDALRSIAGIEGLVHRLEALEICDGHLTLKATDLWALRSLTALRRLCLSLDGLHSSALAPQDLGKQLSLLRDLEIHIRLDEESDVALFPGSLTSLTSLTLCVTSTHMDLPLEALEQFLPSAVRKLTGLRHLCADCCRDTEEGQKQALSALKQLTFLQLQPYAPDEAMGPFTMLSELPELVTLSVPQNTLSSSFLTHPSLQELKAGGVEVPEEWRGKTAAACKLRSLTLDLDFSGTAFDEDMAALPVLSDLRVISVRIYSETKRYPCTAAFLRRQAGTLEQLGLHFNGSFEEALPRDLPVCRELVLYGCSRATLQLPAMCSMPQLERLRLGLLSGLERADDLGWWLHSCPRLRQVALFLAPSASVSDEVKVEVAQMMPGLGLELDWLL